MGREALMVGNDPRNSQMRDSEATIIGTLLAALLFVGGLCWLQASNEAAAFNRVTTGPKVTTWDAVWLDLRVEAR